MKTVLKLFMAVVAVFFVGASVAAAEPSILTALDLSVDTSFIANGSASMATLPILIGARFLSPDAGGGGGTAFVEKSAEEIAKMDAAEMAGYYNAFNKSQFEKIEALRAEDAKKNADAIADLNKKWNDARDSQMKQLNAVLETQGLQIKKLTQAEKSEANKTFIESVKENLKSNLDKLKVLKGGYKAENGSDVDPRSGLFSFKAAGTMLTSSNVSGGNVPVEDREAGLNRIARRRTFMMDLVNIGATSSTVVSWVEQQNPDGGAGGTAEGAVKNQADFDLVVVQRSVKKRTVFIKVSDEMLDDIDFIASEIDNELMELLLLDVDDQILNGDNTGTNLDGVINNASTIAAGIFAGTVDNANLVDVLTVAMDNIENNNHMPTHIVLHPSNVTQLKLIKVTSTDKRYIDRLIMVAGQLTLDGVPIVKNTGMTLGDYLVGDFSKSTVFEKDGLRIEMGYDADDFTKNLRTIRAEWRGVHRIKGNDANAFVTGTIATDASALETP